MFMFTPDPPYSNSLTTFPCKTDMRTACRINARAPTSWCLIALDQHPTIPTPWWLVTEAIGQGWSISIWPAWRRSKLLLVMAICGSFWQAPDLTSPSTECFLQPETKPLYDRHAYGLQGMLQLMKPAQPDPANVWWTCWWRTKESGFDTTWKKCY